MDFADAAASATVRRSRLALNRLEECDDDLHAIIVGTAIQAVDAETGIRLRPTQGPDCLRSRYTARSARCSRGEMA